MRELCSILLLQVALLGMSQEDPLAGPRPLVITETIALPLSMVQVEQAALSAWPYSFGLEPGARLGMEDPGTGRMEGTARFNFRSSTVGNRLQTLGVINYTVTIQAENGQCRVRISHFSHKGNSNATEGAIDLGTIYAAQRPQERIPGISMGTADRLHMDMRTQVTARLQEVIKTFSSGLRSAAEKQ
jgi:hypothetical protein